MFFLYPNIFKYQLNHALVADDAAVYAQIIALGVSPALAGIIIVIACSLFIGFYHDVAGLGFVDFVLFSQMPYLVLLVAADKYGDTIGILGQCIVGAAAYDHAGLLIGQLLDGIKLCQEDLVVDGHIHVGGTGISDGIRIHDQGI